MACGRQASSIAVTLGAAQRMLSANAAAAVLQHCVSSSACVACECAHAGAGRAKVQKVKAQSVFCAAASAAATACVRERMQVSESRAAVCGRGCTAGAGATAGKDVCERWQCNKHTRRRQMRAAHAVAATGQAASTNPEASELHHHLQTSRDLNLKP